MSVSYTHLDVYKRQLQDSTVKSCEQIIIRKDKSTIKARCLVLNIYYQVQYHNYLDYSKIANYSEIRCNYGGTTYKLVDVSNCT